MKSAKSVDIGGRVHMLANLCMEMVESSKNFLSLDILREIYEDIQSLPKICNSRGSLKRREE